MTLVFENGRTETKTNSGKPAVISRNEPRVKPPNYTMTINGEIVFTRGSIHKAIQMLNRR